MYIKTAKLRGTCCKTGDFRGDNIYHVCTSHKLCVTGQIHTHTHTHTHTHNPSTLLMTLHPHAHTHWALDVYISLAVNKIDRILKT